MIIYDKGNGVYNNYFMYFPRSTISYTENWVTQHTNLRDKRRYCVMQ